MTTTIEDKLSAIKAINEEIAYCDRKTSQLAAMNPQALPVIKMGDQEFMITDYVASGIMSRLTQHYNSRKDTLMEKAKALIK